MAGERTFMDQALNVINSTPNHPLAKLVDPETGKWWGRTPWSDAAEDHPTVQAGHRLSKSAGGDRLALQDSQSNQMEGRFVEGQWRNGVHVERDAIEIGGVPVDLEAAKAWEKEGIIPPGTVANAQPVPGWQPGDTLVAPPPDAYPTGTHSESLPGGAGTTTITGDGASATLLAGMSDFPFYFGGGVSVIGTLALMHALGQWGNDQSKPADQTDDDAPGTQPPAKQPPTNDPPVKDPPKQPPPPKDPPPKEPPKDPPPKDPPLPKDPPAAAPPPPPAAPPPPTGASGDSSGGVPGASGGGSAAPEEPSPVPSGATSSLSTGNGPLLAFSYSVSDGSGTADAPASDGSGAGFDVPGIVDGFGVSQPGDTFDIPGPEAGFDTPAPGDAFDLPAPGDAFDLPAPESGFDVPGIGDGFDLPAPEPGFDVPGIDDGFYLPGPDDPFDTSGNGFDLPGPGPGSDVGGTSQAGDFDDDYALPPSFDGGPR